MIVHFNVGIILYASLTRRVKTAHATCILSCGYTISSGYFIKVALFSFSTSSSSPAFCIVNTLFSPLFPLSLLSYFPNSPVPSNCTDKNVSWGQERRRRGDIKIGKVKVTAECWQGGRAERKGDMKNSIEVF